MLDLEAVKEAAIEEEALPWIGAGKYVLMRATEGHILAEGLLMGKYKGK